MIGVVEERGRAKRPVKGLTTEQIARIQQEMIGYNRTDFYTYFATLAAARLATFEYIEGGYNRRRKHSVLNYRTPSQQESYFFTSSMAA